MTKKNLFALNELASVKNGNIIYTVSTADKDNPIETIEKKLYEEAPIEPTNTDVKMDFYIEQANKKIAEIVEDLNNPESYADKDEESGQYTMKSKNSVSTMIGRKMKLIMTLKLFAKLDGYELSKIEYNFILIMTALDRKTKVKAYDGMTIAEFYAENGKIKKSLIEFSEILSKQGLKFKADFTGIERL